MLGTDEEQRQRDNMGPKGERQGYKTAEKKRKREGGKETAEERDRVRGVFVLDVWDVLYSLALAQSPLPDRAEQL